MMASYTLLTMLFCIIAVSQILAQNSNEATSNEISIEHLDEEHCSKGRSGCCDEMYMGMPENLAKCFAIHSAKLPPEDEKDVAKTFHFLSCFVECMYKQRKYVGKSDTINMKMVKLDAETMYADRPKEKEYHIRMYEHCRKDAVNLYNLIKSSPAAKAMLKIACRPYLLMVFLCQSEYHQKHDCPYYRWEGDDKTNTKQMCLDARSKCYAIDGIAVPEDE